MRNSSSRNGFLMLVILSAVSMRAIALDTTPVGVKPAGTSGFTSALKAEDLAREALLNVGPDTAAPTPRLEVPPKNASLLGGAKPKAGGYANIYGSVINNYGTALCAMVLANGEYMFSCAPTGAYALTVPLDSNGQITLFGFADGHFPFKNILGGAGGRADIDMTYAGSAPPPPPPPPATSVITFQLTDACNDGYSIDYKFYDETDNLVWPSSSSHYYDNYGNVSTNNLSCNTGANVCYGASSSTFYWGVGVDNTQTCPDCCITCQAGASLSRTLTCN